MNSYYLLNLKQKGLNSIKFNPFYLDNLNYFVVGIVAAESTGIPAESTTITAELSIVAETLLSAEIIVESTSVVFI